MGVMEELYENGVFVLDLMKLGEALNNINDAYPDELKVTESIQESGELKETKQLLNNSTKASMSQTINDLVAIVVNNEMAYQPIETTDEVVDLKFKPTISYKLAFQTLLHYGIIIKLD